MLKIHAEGVPPSVSGLQWPKEAQQCPGRDRCSLEKERAREMLLLLGQQRPQPEDSAAEPVQGWLVAFALRRSPAALAPQRGKGHTGNIWEKCAQKGVQQFLGFKSGQFCPWGLCYWRQSWAAPAQNKEGNLGEINIQHSNCFLVYCTRLLQNIKNREESLKYTVNFIITKKSLIQQPLKSTENISQALLGAGSRLYKANSFLITSS